MRWRINQPTQEDIDLVNQRLIFNEQQRDVFMNNGKQVAGCNKEGREIALRFSEREFIRKNPLDMLQLVRLGVVKM